MGVREEFNQGRESFSDTIPHLQVAWDSVSLGLFKECPRKYQLVIVEGWSSKRESLHLRYGQLYHRALEVYDHKVCEGEDHETALRSCLRDLAEMCVDYFFTSDPDGVPADALNPEWDELEQGTHYRKWWNPNEYLGEKEAAANPKTVPNLFRTVVWYLERFGPNDQAKTVTLANGKPAVELSFRFPLDYVFPSGEDLYYSGHMDRLVEYGGSFYVLDRKTTKTTIDSFSAQKFFAGFSPDNQMTGYTLASRIVLGVPAVGVIIDAAQIAKGFSRFERGFTMRTETQLTEWQSDLFYYMDQATKFATQKYWPMNDKSCGNYGGCAFRSICSRSPEVRQTFLAGNYAQKFWDPFQVRGDI